jgi:hypothetical protein
VLCDIAQNILHKNTFLKMSFFLFPPNLRGSTDETHEYEGALILGVLTGMFIFDSLANCRFLVRVSRFLMGAFYLLKPHPGYRRGLL